MQCTNKKCGTELIDGAVFCHICGKKQEIPERSKNKKGNSQGSVYKEGDTWTAQVTLGWYTDDNGKRKRKYKRRKGIATKTEALKLLSSLADDNDVSISTLDDLWKAYEPSLAKLSKDKIIAYKKAKRRLHGIIYKPINALKINDLQKVVNAETSTHYTARDMKTVLSHLYKIAIAQQEVAVNLSNFIVLPKLNAKESEPFTESEQNAFWELYRTGDTFVPYILLMIYTGMMPGELMKARKDMIDWEGKQIVGGGLKTNKRKQTPIVIPDIIMPVLYKICELSKGDKFIHINKDRFYDEYYACLERAKVRKLPPYSCRHTTGTALGKSNIPLAVAKEVMRHSKASTTEAYIHIDNQFILDAVNSMNKTEDSPKGEYPESA